MEKGIAALSSILFWRIPWTEEPGGLQSMESQESDMIKQLTLSLFYFLVILVNQLMSNFHFFSYLLDFNTHVCHYQRDERGKPWNSRFSFRPCTRALPFRTAILMI